MTMAGYMLAGIQPDDGGWSGGKESKASFKSNLQIFAPDNEELYYDRIEGGSPTWDFVESGSTIRYEVNTGNDGDRVQLQLMYFDIKGFFAAMENVMNNLSADELKRLEDGDTTLENEIFERVIASMGGWNNVYITIWSNVFNTNSNGVAQGTVRIDPKWEKSQYMFVAHYGYDADAESQTDAYFNQALLIATVALIAASFVVTGGTSALVLGGLNAVMFGIDVMVVGQVLQARKFGVATTNKYDKKFPNWGFNHFYVFNTMDEEEADNVSGSFTEENMQILRDFATLNTIEDVAKFSVGVLAFIVAIKLIKGRKG